MSQQGAAAAAGCCCQRQTEPCPCAAMGDAGPSLTVSWGGSITVSGESSCGATITGSGSFGSMPVQRSFGLEYSSPFVSQCGVNDWTGFVDCTVGQCLDTINCTNPACDEPVYRQYIRDAWPWFHDVPSQQTTGITPACAGVSFSYGNAPGDCGFTGVGVARTYPTATPGRMGFYRSSASVGLAGSGGTPCTLRASASMGILNVLRSQLCFTPVTGALWNVPVSPCNLSGIVASGTKICRYPGDTVKGTYLTGNGPTTSVCDRVMNNSEGNFLYRIRIVVQDPGVITVS